MTMTKTFSFTLCFLYFLFQLVQRVDGYRPSSLTLQHPPPPLLLMKNSVHFRGHSCLSYGNKDDNLNQPTQQQNQPDQQPDENAALLLSPKDIVTRRVRTFFRHALSLAIFTTAINTNTNNHNNQVQAKVFTEDDYLDSLATVILAKKVMEPANQYVDIQAYDNARTNIKYILNDLQLQKKVTVLVQSSIDFADNVDAIDAAGEAAGRIANTAIQYDSTVYTCVFIPSEDGSIPPNAIKYRKQAKEFYEAFNKDADILIQVATTDQLTKAQRLASDRLSKLPVVLFKNENLRQTGI